MPAPLADGSPNGACSRRQRARLRPVDSPAKAHAPFAPRRGAGKPPFGFASLARIAPQFALPRPNKNSAWELAHQLSETQIGTHQTANTGFEIPTGPEPKLGACERAPGNGREGPERRGWGRVRFLLEGSVPSPWGISLERAHGIAPDGCIRRALSCNPAVRRLVPVHMREMGECRLAAVVL